MNTQTSHRPLFLRLLHFVKKGPVEGKGAVEALIDLSKEAAKQEHVHLTLLMLGPLTNLALAMGKEPNLTLMVNELIIMGGCGNGKGNITRTAEFNIFNDCDVGDYFHFVCKGNFLYFFS